MTLSRIPRIHSPPAGFVSPALPPAHADIEFQIGHDYEQQNDVCPPYISSNIFIQRHCSMRGQKMHMSVFCMIVPSTRKHYND